MASPLSGRAGRLAGMWGVEQASNAKQQGQGLLDDYLSRGLNALGQGYGQARTDLNTQFGGAIDRLNPWAEAGKGALTAYQGSLGLGGQAARDAAVASYRTSPGYERRVEEATDAVARKASALGALGSGNTMQAISDRANYLADEDYGRWQGQLSGLSDRGQQAATTQAGLQGQLGQSLAGLGQAQGQGEAGLYGQFAGLGLNNLWQGANNIIGAGTGALTAGQNAAANRLNLLGQGIGFGTKLLGGFI